MTQFASRLDLRFVIKQRANQTGTVVPLLCLRRHRGLIWNDYVKRYLNQNGAHCIDRACSQPPDACCGVGNVKIPPLRCHSIKVVEIAAV